MDVNPLKTTKVVARVCFYLINSTKIVASLHLPPNTRITEAVNMHFAQKPFLPITNVKVLYPDGKEEIYNFMALNKNHIMFCFPVTLKSSKSSTPPGEEAEKAKINEASQVDENPKPIESPQINESLKCDESAPPDGSLNVKEDPVKNEIGFGNSLSWLTNPDSVEL